MKGMDVKRQGMDEGREWMKGRKGNERQGLDEGNGREKT